MCGPGHPSGRDLRAKTVGSCDTLALHQALGSATLAVWNKAGSRGRVDGETDDELVARVADGDRRAFGVLVERRSNRLMALAFRITTDRAAAEDVVQETFARAWMKAPSWTADPRRAAYFTWLARVAVNLAIDQRRKVVPLPLAAVADPIDPTPSAEQILETRQRKERLRAAVAMLPERQRAALSLTYDLGLSNAEAAKSLSISTGALELLLVRARKALRLALADEDRP